MWGRRDKGTEGRDCRVSTCKFVIDVGVAFGLYVDFPRIATAVGFRVRHVNSRAVWIIDARCLDEGLVEDIIIFLL